MFKPLYMLTSTVALVMHTNLAIAQEDPLEQPFEQNEVSLGNTEAALECAVLASKFDNEERTRLIAFAYAQGQESMPAVFEAGLSKAPEADVESIPWDETPYENMRELVAFQLGQVYGKLEEEFFRDIPGDSIEAWEAGYKREYNSRNCSLIGR